MLRLVCKDEGSKKLHSVFKGAYKFAKELDINHELDEERVTTAIREAKWNQADRKNMGRNKQRSGRARSHCVESIYLEVKMLPQTKQ